MNININKEIINKLTYFIEKNHTSYHFLWLSGSGKSTY